MAKSRKARKSADVDELSVLRLNNLEEALCQLTKNVSAMQQSIEKVISSTVLEKDTGDNQVVVDERKVEEKLVQGRSYISLWRDLGGHNITFTPGGMTHPVEFIRKLDRSFNDADVPAHKRKELAIGCMKGSAADWALAREDSFDDSQEFYGAFIKRYWGQEEERKTFYKINYGRYENGSRADYFLKLVREATYLSKPLKQEELLELLIEHFEPEVRRGLLSNGCCGIDEVEMFLRKIDGTYRNEHRRTDENFRGRFLRGNESFNRNRPNFGTDAASLNRNETTNRNGQGVGQQDNQINNVGTVRYYGNQANTAGNRINQTLHCLSGIRDLSSVSDVGNQIVRKQIKIVESCPTFNNEMGEYLTDEPMEIKKDNVTWPMMQVTVQGQDVKALIDSGSQFNCISEEFYNDLKSGNPTLPTLPVTGLSVTGAISAKARRIKTQVFLEVLLGRRVMEIACIVIPTLTKQMILGCEWLVFHRVKLDFRNGIIDLMIDGVNCKFSIVDTETFNEVLTIDADPSVFETTEFPIERPEVSGIYSDLQRVQIAEESTGLSENERGELIALLNKHKNIFSDQPGLTDRYFHEIKMRDSTPFCLRSYPVPHVYREEAQRQIREMLKWGVIAAAQTEYISPLMVVAKKDQSVRVCLDARHLNSKMEKDHIIPPNPGELLFEFSGIKYLSTIDLTAAYWQIPIHPDSRKFTGFQFEGYTYQFQVLPFGLSTSVASFIRGLNLILGNDISEFAVPYVDDILISSSSVREHLQHLDVIFTKLGGANITVKLRKCHFASSSVNFLGHTLTPTGISIDQERIRAIQEFPRPLNIKHLRSFLGMCNFDRRFVDSYSNLTQPLLELLRKGARWKWTEVHRLAFETVKEAYLGVRFLQHPVMGQRFFIECDSSGYGLGACLFQIDDLTGEKKVIAFTSRTLRGAELQYTVTEKEALSILHSLKQWRNLVLGQPLTIITDHKALSFLLKCRLLNSRLSRWTLFLQEYQFEILYSRGKDNILADCLSRYPLGINLKMIEPSRDDTITIHAVGSDEFKIAFKNLFKVNKAQPNDAFCNKIILALKATECPKSVRKWYVVKDGVLYRRGEVGDNGLKICIPKEHIKSLVKQEHEERGHFGASKVYLALRKYFFWPKMRAKIRAIVAGCTICQQTKLSPHLRGELNSVVVDAPNKLACLDLVGPLPRSRSGTTQLLVIIDSFSKLVTLYALRRATTQAIIKKLTTDYFMRIGKPKAILSDNGSQFTKKWKELLAAEDVKAMHTSFYYPQGNPTERINKEIGRLLRQLCYESHTKWANVLKKIETWLNEVIHEGTGFTPLEVHFGKPREEPLLKKLGFTMVADLNKDNIIQLARTRLIKKAEKRKIRHGLKHKLVSLNVGDLVWVRTHPQSSSEDAKIKKFFLLYEGPYRVSKQIGANAYEIIDDENRRVMGNFNLYNLKRYISPYQD